VRLTGHVVPIPNFWLNKYNYAINCLRTPFRDNGVAAAFPGKYLPINTNGEDNQSCGGLLYRLLHWIALVGWLTIFVVPTSLPKDKRVAICAGYFVFYLFQMLFIGWCLLIVIRNHIGSTGRLIWLFTARTREELGSTTNEFVELTHEQYGNVAGVSVDRAKQEWQAFSISGVFSREKISLHICMERWRDFYIVKPCKMMLLYFSIYGLIAALFAYEVYREYRV